MLEYPLSRERDEATCRYAAHVIDALLVRVARGRGALEVAIGDGLEALGSRKMQLGHSTLGDYAREKLGIAASTAQKMARFARELRKRPILRAAVWAGEVTQSAAEAVLPNALGDEEAKWVELARTCTVRALEAAVREGRMPWAGNAADSVEGDDPSCSPEPAGSPAVRADGGRALEDEQWGPIRVRLDSEQMATVEEAMEVARKVVDAAAPRWKLLEALCEEYLGAHGPSGSVTSPDDLVAARREESKAFEEWLERESAQWAFLDQPDPVPAPGIDIGLDATRLHADLIRLSGLRRRWDEVFGHVALLFRSVAGWRWLGFASFAHYCKERLGMAVRSVEQRVALERKCHELPSLEQAMSDQRISYEKARLIARHATADTVDAWIERAAEMPCIDLRREFEQIEKAQLCARGVFQVWAPRRVAGLVSFALGAARKAAGRSIRDGECLVRIAAHFLEIWKPVVEGRGTLSKRILERDGGLCRVPGCSLAANHAHHINLRSAGGSDDPSNLISLCAAHHLHGVHMGWIRVSGKAPDQLRWEVGVGLAA